MKYFSLSCISQFELNYWNKWYCWCSNLLRCSCMITVWHTFSPPTRKRSIAARLMQSFSHRPSSRSLIDTPALSGTGQHEPSGRLMLHCLTGALPTPRSVDTDTAPRETSPWTNTAETRPQRGGLQATPQSTAKEAEQNDNKERWRGCSVSDLIPPRPWRPKLQTGSWGQWTLGLPATVATREVWKTVKSSVVCGRKRDANEPERGGGSDSHH